jgi:hypothetical protein
VIYELCRSSLVTEFVKLNTFDSVDFTINTLSSYSKVVTCLRSLRRNIGQMEIPQAESESGLSIFGSRSAMTDF